MTDKPEDECVRLFETERLRIQLFMNAVRDFFVLNPALNGDPPIVHSTKWRMKDAEHLRDKIRRKNEKEKDPAALITGENFYARVTDLAGVRVLHLHQQQFVDIAGQIREQLGAREWVLYEQPKAYTWDPEASAFFQTMGLDVQLKESLYTSVHYVVKPRADSPISCEIQIRTLFEEIWGEIDHSLNYPYECGSLACVEQLRVLSKLVGAGSRLGDAIFRTHREWKLSALANFEAPAPTHGENAVVERSTTDELVATPPSPTHGATAPAFVEKQTTSTDDRSGPPQHDRPEKESGK